MTFANEPSAGLADPAHRAGRYRPMKRSSLRALLIDGELTGVRGQPADRREVQGRSSSRPQSLAPTPTAGFLHDLHREQRRADRCGSTLSLVLFAPDDETDDQTAAPSYGLGRLLKVANDNKRDTDVLGDIGDHRIALLCPDTTCEGARALLRRIQALTSDLRYSSRTATYPHDLFESLAKGEAPDPSLRPFVVSGAAHGLSGTVDGYRMKRVLDIALALLALLLSAPLMLVVAVAVRMSSPGPVIFKQTRLGKGGVPFAFYKFRSMKVDAADAVHRQFVASFIQAADRKAANDAARVEARSAARPAYKLATDTRITAVGRLIRKTSIDELPQLLNVLKGDMSLVGPRPPLAYEASLYEPWHLRRVLEIKPGITGLWQVDGRSRVTFAEMVRMDLRYIRECSLMLDLRILFKTVVVVLRCDGAV